MIVYHLAFISDKKAHGGKNRSEQLKAWILNQYPHAEAWHVDGSPKPLITLFYGLYYSFFWMAFKPYGFQSLRIVGHWFYAAKALRKKHPGLTHLYMEGTGFGSINLAKYFSKKGVKCIFMPCNLESLVPYDKLWTHKIPVEKRFQQEIKALRFAHKIYAISFTEHWLLQLFNLPSEHLPYQPVGRIAERCARIKNARDNTTNKSGLIYLANFNNGPNQKAFASFLEAYTNAAFEDLLPKEPINVMGRGMEKLEQPHWANFHFLGEQSDAELDEHLMRCVGVILYHYPTTGSLTRLEEYKAMNIPIYANDMAVKHAKSRHFDALHIF